MIEFVTAQGPSDYVTAKQLFIEYASMLPVDLAFQNFSTELERLSDEYGPPHGTLVLVCNDDEPIGCFGIRKNEPSVCELKRMYLRAVWQGKGIGKRMLNEAIVRAGKLGYKKMRLDTLPSMESAISLYTKTGFYEIDPYRFNPVDGTRYFEIVIHGSKNRP